MVILQFPLLALVFEISRALRSTSVTSFRVIVEPSSFCFTARNMI